MFIWEDFEVVGGIERRFMWLNYNYLEKVVKIKIGEEGWGWIGKVKFWIWDFVLGIMEGIK